MSNTSPAYQWYPKDILSSARVAQMTAAEECFYRRALDYAWLNGGIPTDIYKLKLMLGKRCSTRDAKVVLAMFTVTNDPNIAVSPRQELERDKQRAWREKSVIGGRKSAEKKGKGGCNLVATKLEANDKGGSHLVATKTQHCSLQSSISSSYEEDKVSLLSERGTKTPDGVPDAAAPAVSTSAKKKGAAVADPRKDHPAIKLVHEILTRWPHKDIWDKIIRELGDKPDAAFLRTSFETWRAFGGNALNLESWLFEPLRTGKVPEKFTSAGRSPKSTVSPGLYVGKDTSIPETYTCIDCFDTGTVQRVIKDGELWLMEEYPCTCQQATGPSLCVSASEYLATSPSE